MSEQPREPRSSWSWATGLDRPSGHPARCGCTSCTRWRTMRAGATAEPRVSRADERAFASQAHDRDSERERAKTAAARAELLTTLREMADRAQILRDGLRRREAHASRYAHNAARRIAFDLDRLVRELEKVDG